MLLCVHSLDCPSRPPLVTTHITARSLYSSLVPVSQSFRKEETDIQKRNLLDIGSSSRQRECGGGHRYRHQKCNHARSPRSASREFCTGRRGNLCAFECFKQSLSHALVTMLTLSCQWKSRLHGAFKQLYVVHYGCQCPTTSDL